MKLKLPHIPRIITAGVLPVVASGILWALLACFVSLNLLASKTMPADYINQIAGVLTNPLSTVSHENLAQTLWRFGVRADAKRELRIAAELSSSQVDKQVLGATTPVALLEAWEKTPEREEAEIEYWRGVAARHPDYRDAYMQLAALSYARGNLLQTKEYLAQAANLDPNGKGTQELLTFVTRLLE